jgi:acetone carboxylase gamma subunit
MTLLEKITTLTIEKRTSRLQEAIDFITKSVIESAAQGNTSFYFYDLKTRWRLSEAEVSTLRNHFYYTEEITNISVDDHNSITLDWSWPVLRASLCPQCNQIHSDKCKDTQ